MAKKLERKQLSKETLNWIESHPEIVGHLDRLREVSEDPQSDLKTLETAERAVIEEITRLGGEALKGWMQGQEAKASQEASGLEGVRKHSKKNF